MADSSGMRFDVKGLVEGLSRVESKSDASIRMYAETSAQKLQGYAREHRPWTDRTGQARQRLTGDAMVVEKGYQLRLAHGVDYGIWLELAHEMRFAIIKPTILSQSGEIIKGFENLLERME